MPQKCYKIGRTKEEYSLKIFDAASSLLEIEDLLEERLESKETKENLVSGKLDLNYEDYRYLLFKLKGLARHKNEIEILERYRLSIITAMIFTIRNEKPEESYEYLKELFLSLPQHQLRQYLNICKEAFDEYALHSFEMNFYNFDAFYQVLTIHAGTNGTLNITSKLA